MTIVDELRADAASGDCSEDTSNRMRAAADRIEAQERVIAASLEARRRHEAIERFEHDNLRCIAQGAVDAFHNGWGILNNPKILVGAMSDLQAALKDK